MVTELSVEFRHAVGGEDTCSGRRTKTAEKGGELEKLKGKEESLTLGFLSPHLPPLQTRPESHA